MEKVMLAKLTSLERKLLLRATINLCLRMSYGHVSEEQVAAYLSVVLDQEKVRISSQLQQEIANEAWIHNEARLSKS